MKRLIIATFITVFVFTCLPLHAQVCRGVHAGVVSGAVCTTPSQGTYSEGFEGSNTCSSGEPAACENENKWTVTTGSPTFGYTLTSPMNSPMCTKGLNTDFDDAAVAARMDYGSELADAKVTFYMRMKSCDAGTDLVVISVNNQTSSYNNGLWASIGLWNNAGAITVRANGLVASARLPVTTGKWYKITIDGRTTEPAAGSFKVEDCSSGTCSDVAGSPDTTFRASAAGGSAARYIWVGGVSGGAGDTANIEWDAFGMGASGL